jgi:hypothetical protein
VSKFRKPDTPSIRSVGATELSFHINITEMTKGNEYAKNNLNNLLSSLYCNNSSIPEFGLVDCPKTALTNLERRREISCGLDDFLHGVLDNARFIPLDCVVV